MLQLRLVVTTKHFAFVFIYSKFTTFKILSIIIYNALFTTTGFKNFSNIHIHDILFGKTNQTEMGRY